jgi:hypothetical protein
VLDDSGETFFWADGDGPMWIHPPPSPCVGSKCAAWHRAPDEWVADSGYFDNGYYRPSKNGWCGAVDGLVFPDPAMEPTP